MASQRVLNQVLRIGRAKVGVADDAVGLAMALRQSWRDGWHEELTRESKEFQSRRLGVMHRLSMS